MCEHPHTSTATLPNALHRKHRQQLEPSSSYSSRYPLPAPHSLQLLQGHTPLTGDAHQVLCAPANTCLLVPRAGCGLPSSCQSHSPPAMVFKMYIQTFTRHYHFLRIVSKMPQSRQQHQAPIRLSSFPPVTSATSTRPSPACPCVPRAFSRSVVHALHCVQG